MSLTHKLLARSVVLILLFGLLPALQQPAAAQNTATYTATKYDCAPGYDPSSGDANAAFSNCTTPAGGISFTLQSGDSSYGGGTQQTDGSGSVSWSGIPLGSGYSVSESVPNGYGTPWVYCEVSGNPNNPGDVQQSFFAASGGNMDVGYSDPSLTAYTQSTCYWFNSPPAQQNGQTQQYGGSGTVIVHIEKYLCDATYDYQNASANVFQDCQSPHTNVKFTVNGGNSSTTGNDGAVDFSSLPSGQQQIRLIETSGYVPILVGCIDWDNSQSGTPDKTMSTKVTWTDEGNGSYLITGNLAENHSYYCYWYDIPSGNGTVHLYKYYCDPSFDWQNGGYDYLSTGCTNPQPDVYFEIQNGSYTQGETTDSDGAATWTDVPQGDVKIAEQVPDGYQVGRIFCGVAEENNATQPTSWDEYTYSDGYHVQVPSGKYVHCYIFDIPADYGTIYLYKYYCDPTFDWENGSYDYLLSGCTNPQSNVSFEVHNGGYSEGQTSDSSGTAAWSDVPSGSLDISEQSPDGYVVGRVFCGYSSDSSTLPTSWDEYTYSQGIQVELPGGQYLFCVYFNVPSDYGTVTLYKYYCDPSFDWENGGYDYLLSGCTNPQSNVYFDGTSGSYSQGQTTDSSGAASWTGVPAGDFGFVEQPPDGYQVGRIFCGYSDQQGTPPTSWDEYSYSDGWSVSYETTQYLTCYVFDVPYDTGTVYLYKYYCDPSFDWQSGSYDYLYSGCTSPQSGVEFDLSSGSASLPGVSTSSDGSASWSGMPAGDLTFVEQIPNGYQVGRIFCGYSDTDGTEPTSWDEYTYSSGWTVPNPSGQYVYCYIFDVPYTYTTVYFYKYYCDPSFDWQSGGYDYLYSGCTTPQSDVQFDLSSGSYSSSQTTDSSGAASWADVPQDDFHAVEQAPDGYQVGRIFCGYSDTDGTPPTSWDEYSYSNGWDVSNPSGQYIYCYIFDVPYDTGTVYLYKYYCDPTFDWESNGYDYLLSGCTTPQENVNFETYGNNYNQGQTTDSSGAATWADVPWGNLSFSEEVPDGYQVGRIFCGYSDTDGTPPTSWDEYSYSDGWDVPAPSGKYLYCYVFDVPSEYGWVTIWKYNCPQDFDYASSEQSYYESSCTDRPQGVEFDLSNDSYGYQQSQSTDSSGAASWSDVPSGGSLYLYEVPNGYEPIAVYCGVSSDGSEPSSWDPYTLDSDGGLSGVSVDPNAYLICKWFNKPYDNPQVWIYKYNCDQSAQWNWAYHQLLSHCTTSAPDVEFGFGPQGSDPSLSVTDDQGKWLYQDLQPGVWYWQETYPSGYSGAVVYCQWVGAYGSGDYQQASLDGSTLWLDVEHGDVVTCYWFDFPTGYAPPSVTPTSGGSSGSGSSGSSSGSGTTSGGTGTSGGSGGSGGPPPLTSNVPTVPKPGGPAGGTTTQSGNPNAPATLILVKRTCPEGFDLYGKDADVEKDCTDLTSDIDFGLTDLSTPDAEPIDQTTGNDGKVTWTNLKAGPYLIVESLPQDTYAAFIWTCKSDQRQFQTQYPFTPFSYAGPNGEIGITLIGGEKLECTWYNVPTAPAEVTILKFECPGSPVIVAQCIPAGAGVAFNLTPAGGAVGTIVQLTTDDSGSASGTGVAGAYTLAEQGGTPCLIDSESMNDQGQVELVGGTPAEVKVYNCGGGGS